MNWQRLKEPSFLAAAASCVMLLILLISRSGSSSAMSDQQLSGMAAPQSGEFEEAVSLTESHLSKNDFAPAFDMVMVASRIAPSDPRLFDLVMKFIEKATGRKDDAVIAMEEDLLDRADSLVYFQSPKRVEPSRKRLTEARQSISKPSSEATPQSPLEPVRKLLDVAENRSVPLGVRSNAAEQARSGLDDALLDQALSPVEQGGDFLSEELKQLQSRMDKAEKQCIKELFLQCKPKIDLWLKATSSLTGESNSDSSDKVPEFVKRIKDSVAQGLDIMQEVMPYSKSGVEGAAELSEAVENQVKLLQRQKDWLYNQQVLRLVREIESKKEWTPEDKIRCLATVNEELLLPYLVSRRNELWDKAFESLPNEDKKAWALRLRILRLNDEETRK